MRKLAALLLAKIGVVRQVILRRAAL